PQDMLPADRAAFWNALYQRALSGERFSLEHELRHQDTTYFVELFFNPIVIDGKVTGTSVFARNITDRKRAEERVQKWEANLTALIENPTDPIWSVDRDYRLVTFNTAAAEGVRRIYGKELALGMSMQELVTPQEQRYWAGMYERVLREERVTDVYET